MQVAGWLIRDQDLSERRWSVAMKNWTGNKELEERRTWVPCKTKSGALAGCDEIDEGLGNPCTFDRSWATNGLAEFIGL